MREETARPACWAPVVFCIGTVLRDIEMDRGDAYADHSIAAAPQQPVPIPAFDGKYRILSKAPQCGGGESVPGALRTGGLGGTECAH